MRDKRVQLDEITVDLVDKLKKYGGIKKSNELIVNAVSVLNWAVRAALNGKQIAAYDEESGELELYSMPLLDRVREQNNSKPKKKVRVVRSAKEVSNH
jgi:hypothetical protein